MKSVGPTRRRCPVRQVMVLVAMAVLMVCQLAHALESGNRESLRGLKGVNVLIEDLEAEVERDGMSKDQIQTDVELRLRKAGIRVLTEQESIVTPGLPYLYVRLAIYRRTNLPVYAYNIHVALSQVVRPERTPTL